MRKKRHSRQQVRRFVDKKCYFCPNDNPAVLHCHRIFEGQHGGTYDPRNTVCACANCHSRIHAGQIVIHGRHPAYGGDKLWVLHYTEDGVEKWL
jgi:hypothetical protein